MCIIAHNSLKKIRIILSLLVKFSQVKFGQQLEFAITSPTFQSLATVNVTATLEFNDFVKSVKHEKCVAAVIFKITKCWDGNHESESHF